MPPNTREDPRTDLTEAQREAFRNNESDFAELEKRTRSVREAASARLRDADWDSGGNSPCFVCPCADFLGESSVCERDFCRDPATKHA